MVTHDAESDRRRRRRRRRQRQCRRWKAYAGLTLTLAFVTYQFFKLVRLSHNDFRALGDDAFRALLPAGLSVQTTRARASCHDDARTAATAVRHVVFSSYKCGLSDLKVRCSPRRLAAETNSQNQWRAIACRSRNTPTSTPTTPTTIAFLDLSNITAHGIQVNQYHVPVLSSMYLRAQQLYPNASTYSYVNADILPDLNFFDTVDAVLASPLNLTRFLIVGRRTNVDWYDYYNVSDFDQHFSRGHIFWDNAQDYFIASRNSINWTEIPPFVIGRAAYDNWLVDYTHHHPNISLIDATRTIRAIHQTDEDGNSAQGGKLVKDSQDLDYNKRLGQKKWDHGYISKSPFESYYPQGNESRKPQVRRKRNKRTIVVVLRVSKLQWDLLENWVYHYKRLDINLRKLVITCTDEETFVKYGPHKAVLPSEAHVHMDPRNPAAILLDELRYTRSILYTEVDTVWLSDPLDVLTTTTNDDLICAMDHRHGVATTADADGATATGNVTTTNITTILDAHDNEAYNDNCLFGFMAIRKTARVQKLLKEWDTLLSGRDSGVNEDPLRATTILRQLLQKSAKSTEPLKVLLPSALAVGVEYFVENKNSSAALVVHCNHVHGTEAKMEAFKEAGLWNASSQITMQRQSNELQTALYPDGAASFTIIILTMDRFASLQRLIQSLYSTDYLLDRVDLLVRFDKPRNPTSAWVQNVEAFRKSLQNWKAGKASLVVAKENMGLRKAWLEAWQPMSPTERAIIFEDDVEVSPLWYKWLQGAHDAYDERSDIAGISLQRQTLVPLKSAQRNVIPHNDGRPFLYKLVGSIGFSPKASVWMDFLDFAECALAGKLDVGVPGLVTSDWYKQLDQRGMWTQLFIHFCDHRALSTLYAFPQQNLALAAHWREKGENFASAQGRDFALALTASEFSFEYPTQLLSLGWDAKPVEHTPSVRSLVMSVAIGYGQAEFSRFVTGLRQYYQGSIALLISSSAPAQVRQLLAGNNVIVVEMDEKGGPRESEAWHRINKSRYKFYQDTCQETVYDLCMTLDFRDILFQGDPFAHVDFPSRPTLDVYEHNLRVNNWALRHAEQCVGGNPESIRRQWMINAGGLIATPSVIHRIARINEDFGVSCDDQVALNLAVYGNYFSNETDIVKHKQGTGSINNVAYDGVFRYDSRRRFLNHNCFPSAVVHQFNDIESTRGQSRLP